MKQRNFESDNETSSVYAPQVMQALRQKGAPGRGKSLSDKQSRDAHKSFRKARQNRHW